MPKAAGCHSEGTYREAVGGGIAHRRDAGAMMAASAYVACLEMCMPRTLRDAANAANAASARGSPSA